MGCADERGRPLAHLTGRAGRPLRLAHLSTVDMSLALLLATELQVDLEIGAKVYGISAPGEWVAEIEALGVTHVPIPSLTRSWDLPKDLRACRELYEILHDLDLDVLHTHTPKAGVLGRIVGRAARIPTIVNTVHGLWADRDDRFAKRAMVMGAEVVAAQFSDAELYQNADDRARLAPFVRRYKSATVGNGVELSRFSPDPAARERIREELGVGEHEVLVGGVGRQVAEKGINEFAAAADVLTGKARFVWIGPADPDKPDALDAASTGIEAVGLRRDMAAIYQALDVFVLPSYREGFSRSGMEAAASGCAVVLSDIRGCREVVRHEIDGLLVPKGNAAALTSAVGRLIQDPDTRARLGEAARSRAMADFDQRDVARRSLKAYKWARTYQQGQDDCGSDR